MDVFSQPALPQPWGSVSALPTDGPGCPPSTLSVDAVVLEDVAVNITPGGVGFAGSQSKSPLQGGNPKKFQEPGTERW